MFDSRYNCTEDHSVGGLQPTAIYSSLRVLPSRRAYKDPFTAHVFTCILTMGILETVSKGVSIATAVGLNRGQFEAIASKWLPGATAYIDFRTAPIETSFDEEEDQIRALLDHHRSDDSDESHWLVAMLTRRSMSANHLWQDLGLLDRSELNRLMNARFHELAVRNVSNMKWKKFFYRCLCEMEGFTLCTAPTCRECNDFENCFGDESGQSALARLRQAVDTAA